MGGYLLNFKEIDSLLTGGNDWSTETSPPPPPGVKYRRKSGGSKGRGGMSVVKGNIKSSNILLDADLNPRLSDYGLSQFYLKTSQNLGEGYNAPEAKNPSESTPKSDVYRFGVATLLDALSNIADPALHGLYPPKSLSRLADIIALCVQVEPEFRPPMSEAVEAFVRMVQRSTSKRLKLFLVFRIVFGFWFSKNQFSPDQAF
ncbi:hypothetical protein F2Q69_00050024 [Brassica cretica]|uniref:Protein kinase domain-containing protein n=1 Tax=Brassica cretica TaxID=69181 RepID=A0A8S9PF51_BRACR|nr:hypothetical protein F2Q69_00050024 [Brassica cretica]